jgi:hypothetical protein
LKDRFDSFCGLGRRRVQKCVVSNGLRWYFQNVRVVLGYVPFWIKIKLCCSSGFGDIGVLIQDYGKIRSLVFIN